jgi:hypothetical protein
MKQVREEIKVAFAAQEAVINEYLSESTLSG